MISPRWVYNYFRDYDPVVGRYAQSDPIGLAGGLNPYLYANGNPLRYADPYGLFGFSDATDAVFGAVWQHVHLRSTARLRRRQLAFEQHELDH